MSRDAGVRREFRIHVAGIVLALGLLAASMIFTFNPWWWCWILFGIGGVSCAALIVVFPMPSERSPELRLGC